MKLMIKCLLKWFINFLLLLMIQMNLILMKIKIKLFKISETMSVKNLKIVKHVKKIRKGFEQ